MAIKRDSLRAQRDFYSPMTGNTGTEIRYAAAPTRQKDTYGSQVKSRLSEIGKGTRRSAPIIKAIKTAMKKTDDPFTQIAEKKSYAPQEENDIGAQIQGLAGQAQDAIGEGVAQAEQAFEGYKKSQSKKQSERRAERAAERAADLKTASDARQNIRTDFQNRVRGVSDEVSGVRQQVKTYESNREKQRRLTQARLKGVESKQEATTRETKTYRDNRERQRALRQSSLDKRISGVESGVSGIRSEVKAYETNREKQRRLTQSRLKGVESGLSNLGKDYKRQEQEAINNMAKFRAERDARRETVDRRLGEQDKKVGEVKTNLATTYGGVVGLRESLAAIKAKQDAPKTVTVGGQTVAAKQSVASLPSNYKATEAKAFAQAKAFQQAKKVAQRNPNVSISKTTGKAEATNNSARARAQAAAVNRKMSGKSISQTKAANRASMKQAAAARHASFKKAKAAGTHTRTAAGQRARNKAAAKARAKAAAKARNKKKNQNRRGGASRRRGRRRGRRCDIFLKFDISLLTNNNLRHDELAEVAYFVRALREVEL
jgi:hypothetical protein